MVQWCICAQWNLGVRVKRAEQLCLKLMIGAMKKKKVMITSHETNGSDKKNVCNIIFHLHWHTARLGVMILLQVFYEYSADPTF